MELEAIDLDNEAETKKKRKKTITKIIKKKGGVKISENIVKGN